MKTFSHLNKDTLKNIQEFYPPLNSVSKHIKDSYYIVSSIHYGNSGSAPGPIFLFNNYKKAEKKMLILMFEMNDTIPDVKTISEFESKYGDGIVTRISNGIECRSWFMSCTLQRLQLSH